jgi:Protein of unknown function (DUF3108)
VKTLFIWTSVLLLAFSGQTYAANSNSTLTYDVYAGGIHAMNAKLIIKQSPSRYDITLTAETQGMLKSLADWSGKFLSNGKISKNNTFPLTHQSASTWKKVTESKTFKYDGKGHFVSYKVAEGNQDKTPKDVDLSLAKDTTDILSSTFHLMASLPTSKICVGKELIFDGDRNYRLVFADTQTETLKKSDYNAYSGESISCTVEVVPEKGKWRKKPRGWLSIQEQGRQKGSLPTVWFAQIKAAPNIYVPVRIRIKTDYGVLFMHLTSAKTQ